MHQTQYNVMSYIHGQLKLSLKLNLRVFGGTQH